MVKHIRKVISVEVHSLASGSSGNAMLVRAGDTNLLIDAGLPVRTLANALLNRGVAAADLHGILLTHEHSDHSCGAGGLARRNKTPLIANAATFQAYTERDALPFMAQELETGNTTAIGSIGIRSFAVSHDAAEPVGYVLEAGTTRIVYFTDTGCVTPVIREALRGVHLAIVEANHDLEWLRRGPYAPHMKERVASDTGHLSNSDCADVLAERLDEEGTCSIWLAHLSRVNNSTALARRTVQQRIMQHTRTPFSLEVALRDQVSLTWTPGNQAVQLALL